MKNCLKKRLLNGLLWSLLLGICGGCEEPFEMDSAQIPDGIAMDGVITNEPPPYFFRITHLGSIGNKKYEGIMDAVVVITDHTVGVKDTLKALVPYRDPIIGDALQYYNYHTGKIVRQYLGHVSEDLTEITGVYATTKIYGIEGHRYSFDMLYQGEHHTAEETMIPHTPITELKIKEVDLGVKGKVNAPCISFVNRADEENYYLLNYNVYSTKTHRIASIMRMFTADSKWKHSIFSDELLEENVVDFLVSDGVVDGLPGIGYPSSSDSLFVCMQSLSKACYNSYEDMMKQATTDGGAYTPRPGNIRGNISGGVLGLFRVSAISEQYALTKRK